MFQRMEPPSEGGGTDGQGGQGQNGLSSTQLDNINSMWVENGGSPYTLQWGASDRNVQYKYIKHTVASTL